MLTKSAELSAVKLLHNKLFYFQEYQKSEWVEKGTIAIFENTMFCNDIKLYHVNYNALDHTIRYSFGKGELHKSGILYFTQMSNAFIGSLSNVDGTVTQIRGNTCMMSFQTVLTAEDGSKQEGPVLEMGTRWQGEILEQIYKLEGEDISNCTTVTNVDHQTWETTIEKTKATGLIEDKRTFQIVVDYTGTSFTGIYFDGEKEQKWNGTATLESQNCLQPGYDYYQSIDQKGLDKVYHYNRLSSKLREEDELVSGTSLQDLLNISPIEEIQDGGKTIVVDVAQEQAGSYFQDILINSLDDTYLSEFFTSKREIPNDVQKVKDAHKDFYRKKSIMNLGQLLHHSFNNSSYDRQKQAVRKINIDKIKQTWENSGKEKEFAEQSSELYLCGYRNRVFSIQPYLEKGAEWHDKLYNYIISPGYINIWRLQIASQSFSNVKSRIYEYYTKLCILDNTGEKKQKNQHVVSTLFSTVLNISAQQMQWNDEYKEQFKKLLIDAIVNLKEGNIEKIEEELAKENVKELQETLSKVINLYDDITTLAEAFISAIATKAAEIPESKEVRIIDLVEDVIDKNVLEELTKASFGKVVLNSIKKCFKVLMYTACLGVVIYLFVDGGKILTPIEDISLSIVSVSLLVKGMESFLETRLGTWFIEKIGGVSENMAEFCGKFTQWFSKEGVPIENMATKIFGRNATEFMKTRLGPAMAVCAIIVSSFLLDKAIKTGDTFNIVFESINIAFSALDVLFIGLSLASFGWAGPVGIAVAVIGVVVALFQMVWNLFHEPTPPADPVESFVNGPLKKEGFVCA